MDQAMRAFGEYADYNRAVVADQRARPRDEVTPTRLAKDG
jgi:hypothetical protein